MYLKRLDILGFKSFADKTAVKFSDGITAIVGPNGCGKTNILDSLRWVLGEQRTSLLRGSKMEEVIFSGTNDVKPLGMAEVTLSLVNNRGVLPTEYNEVQITRRLFRSGESEYLLNKVPCRLKDITELFYDTGMGAHSYSVIQQDMIEAVISDKAEERRFLFEEAAGITKYKQRKKAALRKLEATQNDLLRLQDIYAEVQTQVRSLKRQYKKAERYQSISDTIKAWELYLGAQRIQTTEQSKQQTRAQIDEITNKIVKIDSSVDMHSARLENQRKSQVDIEHELTQVGNTVYSVNERAHDFEKQISILTEKRTNSRSLIDRNKTEIVTLEQRDSILDEQIVETEETLKIQREEAETLSQQLTKLEATQAELDKKLVQARMAREQENQRLLELEGKLSSGKAEENSLRTQLTDLEQQKANLSEQRETSKTESEEIIKQLQIEQEEFDKVADKKNATQSRQEELTTLLEKLVEQNEAVSLEISNLTASKEACQARISLLEEMILHYEGYEAGVVATMDNRDQWDGLAGTVAEKFVPSEGLESATAAALGEMAGYIICNNRSSAERIISYLKEEQKGKIGILVPSAGMLDAVVKRPEIDLPEFMGWLDSQVTTDDELKPLMQAVLSRTAIYRAGADPSALLERLPYGFQAVSTDGLVYSKNVISGGSDDRYSLFRREEKVDEEKQQLMQFQAQLDEAHERKNKLIANIASVRAESGQTVELLSELTDEVQTRRTKVNELTYKRQAIQTEISRLEREHKQISDKLEQIQGRQYNLGLDYSELADRKKDLVGSMSTSSQQLTEYEQLTSASLEKLSRTQVESVEARSRIEQSESKLKHIRELKNEIASTIRTKQAEIVQAKEEIETATAEINRLEHLLKETFEERTVVSERQSELRENQEAILEQVKIVESELKELRLEKESLSNEKHQLEMRLTTVESEIKALSERLNEDYEVDIHTIQPECPDDSFDITQADTMLAEKKEQLRKFGAVNLLALEEYRTASEREEFLGEQLEDLNTARNDLQTTISKINQTARQLFLETFDQVRKNFQGLFVKLFTGGEADIKLIDPNNPLESDIEITARPRGKKQLSITMMSGGERALTAISLLFSLYMVKPSPFCILDEIDAPLDDANCRRFLTIIDSFSKQTQFILITHNKISMEAAVNLYGVTMERPGISQLVAVRFNEDKDEVNVEVDTSPPESEEVPNIEDDSIDSLPDAIKKRLETPATTSEATDQTS